MALHGLLREGEGIPRSVSLQFDEEHLLLSDSRGWTDSIRYNWLHIREDRGGMVVIGRRWSAGFKLQLSGEAARVARDVVPQPQPWSRRLLDLAKSNPKLILALVVAPFILADHLPGEWFAGATPRSAAMRLEGRALEKVRHQACDDASGQAALDTLTRKLTRQSAGPVDAIAVNEINFMVSGRPGGQLLAFRPAIVEVDADVLAALIAHELAHIEAGDTLRATGRGEGSNYLLRLAVPWWEDQPVKLIYSKAEERAADDAAMAKLLDAGIPLRPAADFFARIDQANQGDRYWAQDYSGQHSGASNRAAVWRIASGNQGATRPALSERQADELFNICWERPVGVATKWSQVSG